MESTSASLSEASISSSSLLTTELDGLCMSSMSNAQASCPNSTDTSPVRGTRKVERMTFEVAKSLDYRFGDPYYNMMSPNRGTCLIVNNIVFYSKELNRDGSEQEGEILEELFTQLNFKVDHRKNLNGDEITTAFQNAALDVENSNNDAFIGIVLSHGHSRNTIYGVDGSLIMMDAILEFFNNTNCPRLIKKPKMFFVQSCRGDKKDPGVALQTVADAIGFLAPKKIGTTRIPTWTDTMVCYSTIDGYASLRNKITGSWFGDALIKVFCEHAKDTELNALLSMVNSRLNERVGDVDATQSIEIIYRGWCKQLYFDPGHFSA